MLSLRQSRVLSRACPSQLRSFSIVQKIIYTETDEAPALATYSLLPIVNKFAQKAGILVEKSDISLSGRILSHFPEKLTEAQRIPDNLAALGQLALTPDANIIKLPNVSASIPQLNEAITELRTQGYDIPLYPATPTTDEEKAINATYSKVLGSAVNPVLREGNSDRRVAAPVKQYAQKNPHKMGSWSSASKSHVSHMTHGDFYASEQSVILPAETSVTIEFTGSDGKTVVMKNATPLKAGEVIDSSFMSKKALCEFFDREIADRKSVV